MIISKKTINIDILREILLFFNPDILVYTTPSGDYEICIDDSPIEKSREIEKLIKDVPSNAKLTKNDISLGKTVCADYASKTCWTCDDHCNVMDGKYLISEEKLSKIPSFMKECNCTPSNNNIYHFDDVSLAQILYEGLYVESIISTIMKTSPDARLDSIWELVLRWHGNPKVSWYDNLSFIDAVSIRYKLSQDGVPSMLTQNFDGKYIVFRSTDGEGGVMSPNHLYPLKKIQIEDLDEDIIMGWKTDDIWLGFI